MSGHSAEKDAHIQGCLAEYPLGCLGIDCGCHCHAEKDAMCGEPVNSDPDAPCTYPLGHAQGWHTHDGTLIPSVTTPVEGRDS